MPGLSLPPKMKSVLGRLVKPSTDDSDDTSFCDLCKKRVPVTDWLNGTHREQCAAECSKFLLGLSAPHPSVTCPTCRSSLRVWPANDTTVFCCRECPTDERRHVSDGSNLFRCYPCYYDLCSSCVGSQVDSVASSIPSAPPAFPEGGRQSSEVRGASGAGNNNPTPLSEDRSQTPPPSYEETMMGRPGQN